MRRGAGARVDCSPPSGTTRTRHDYPRFRCAPPGATQIRPLRGRSFGIAALQRHAEARSNDGATRRLRWAGNACPTSALKPIFRCGYRRYIPPPPPTRLVPPARPASGPLCAPSRLRAFAVNGEAQPISLLPPTPAPPPSPAPDPRRRWPRHRSDPPRRCRCQADAAAPSDR